MLLPDNGAGIAVKTISAALVAMGLLSAGACTVRPLHGEAGVTDGQGASAALSSIEVMPVPTRQALEVRNHLIFLLSGGAGQPANPEFRLSLAVKSVTESAATIQIARDNEPSAGTVRMTASYLLTNTETGEVFSSGKRSTSASYDELRQEFATLRAERDAENRAARELAELLRLALVHDMSRGGRL